jgi:formiminotetrahydrofolate cyclodeaminase
MTYGLRPIDDFLSDVASERVTPAGGTVTAVVGAAGASLCEMGCLHTAADDPATELVGVGEDLRRRRQRLLTLADADADAVEALLAAADDDARETRRAVGVPLAVAEACAAVVDGGVPVIEVGNRTVISDAVAGVTLAGAAVRASAFTVRTNLSGITDPAFAERVRDRVVVAERSATDASARAVAAATDRLGVEPPIT